MTPSDLELRRRTLEAINFSWIKYPTLDIEKCPAVESDSGIALSALQEVLTRNDLVVDISIRKEGVYFTVSRWQRTTSKTYLEPISPTISGKTIAAACCLAIIAAAERGES